ncbi:MAG: Ig domain-containing protein [Parcubacteria group bacterium Gr01-1014_33]|nr:MAG: Ig domain-containing protein [Parcubacteria group bacterium Gr01-1014_33]
MMIYHRRNTLRKKRAGFPPTLTVSAGFTLVELLVTISIISVLASVILTNINSAREKARIGAGKHLYAQLDSTLNEVVGKWSFEEGSGSTVRDGSGYGNNGTINGGASWPTASQCGLELRGCLSFNGTNAYIVFGQILPPSPTQPFTFAAWVNITSPTSAGGTYWKTIIGTHISLAQIAINNLTVNMGQNGGGGWWITGGDIALGRWHHIVGVYDGAKASLFVDGRRTSGPTTHAFSNSHGQTVIGSYRADFGAELMNGVIDEARVYSEALTAYEIQQMYGEGASTHRVAENPN